MTITSLSTPEKAGKRLNDRRSICEARSRVDSILAGPPITPMVPILREPLFVREAMVQLREARGRLGRAPTAPAPETSADPHLDPIAEFILTEAQTIDLRIEASLADHNLRLARLAGRAAAILDQIARERAAADARVAPSDPLIPGQDWNASTASTAPPTRDPDNHGVSPAGPLDRPEAEPSGFTSLDELAATIRLLGSLRDEGLVTDAEFESKKAELLARL